MVFFYNSAQYNFFFFKIQIKNMIDDSTKMIYKSHYGVYCGFVFVVVCMRQKINEYI